MLFRSTTLDRSRRPLTGSSLPRSTGIEHPLILSGAPKGATYSLVGDDMGRIEFARPGDRLAVGDVVEVMPPHCYQTLCLYSHYHVVQGDSLFDIWPVSARESC